MRTTPRRAAALLIGFASTAALSAGPGLASSSAQSLHRAWARSTVTAKVTLHRTAQSSMSATAVATVAGGTAAPIKIKITSSARTTATATVRSKASSHQSARAHTRRAALAAAHKKAKRSATTHARSRATTLAAHSAATKAAAAARAKALATAENLAKASATAKAKAAAPSGAKISASVVAAGSPSPAACGGERPARTAGGTYTTCTFDDEFTGTGLDPTKWTAMDTSTSRFHIGDECFTPKNVSVSAGQLGLNGTRSAAATSCDGRSTRYKSGLVSTKGLFSQAYGRFEIRAKFPAGIGLGSGFWMLPENPAHDGGYEYGEIDVVENWGLYSSYMWAHLHYATTPTLAGGKMCSVPSKGAFHTYAVDWTAQKMTFSYDGKACWSTTWRPDAGYAAKTAKSPAPFDQPFYLILNLTLGGSASTAALPLALTKLPAAMQVDYVRAWK